jgi:hypothetical protein
MDKTVLEVILLLWKDYHIIHRRFAWSFFLSSKKIDAVDILGFSEVVFGNDDVVFPSRDEIKSLV